MHGIQRVRPMWPELVLGSELIACVASECTMNDAYVHE